VRVRPVRFFDSAERLPVHVKISRRHGARTPSSRLVLYALLPIIRNTFIGISNVDPAIRDAGRGYGHDRPELLFRSTLPRARVIIAGGARRHRICVALRPSAAPSMPAVWGYIFAVSGPTTNVLILPVQCRRAKFRVAADLLLGYVEAGDSIRGADPVAFEELLWSGAGRVAYFWRVSFSFRGPAGRIAVGSKTSRNKSYLGEILAQAIGSENMFASRSPFRSRWHLAHERSLPASSISNVEYTVTALLAF